MQTPVMMHCLAKNALQSVLDRIRRPEALHFNDLGVCPNIVQVLRICCTVSSVCVSWILQESGGRNHC